METELDRYARQMRLPDVGEDGQRRLLASHAVVVGVGSLGCLSSELLARAGVGRLTLIDRDLVERSNLSRQTLFTEADALEALPKAAAARRRLQAINPTISIDAHAADLNAANAESLTTGADVIVDGVDTFETRYLLNDLAVKHGVPYVHGGAVGGEGSMLVVRPGVTACLRCLEPTPPAPGSTPTCESAGVLGPAAAAIASLQAAAVLRGLLCLDEPAALWRLDLLRFAWTRIALDHARDPACSCCVRRRFEALEADVDDAAFLCSADSVQITPGGRARVDLPRLAERLSRDADVSLTPFYLRGRLRERNVSLTVFPDARVIVKGVSSVEQARGLHARYVGA